MRRPKPSVSWVSVLFTFSAHDSLVLLQHSFAFQNIHYLLRTTPCFLSGHLEEYDSVLCFILNSVTNCPWSRMRRLGVQASLSVKLGGLGIQRAVQSAPSAYLSSTAATLNLVTTIVNTKNSHLCTITMTQVWDTNSSAKTKTNRDPQSVIIQSQT